MNATMTPTRFRALAEAYGGAIDRWPEAERRAARELLLRDPGLRAVLDAESELDTLFAESEGEGEPLDPALASRLAALPERSPQPFPFRPRTLVLPALGWAAAAGLGLWLGTSFEMPGLGPESETGTEAALVAEGDEPTVLELAAGDFGLGEVP